MLSSQALTAYEKKKYVWKLLYIYMLGYEVEFGLVEATSLISASKYAEKQARPSSTELPLSFWAGRIQLNLKAPVLPLSAPFCCNQLPPIGIIYSLL